MRWLTGALRVVGLAALAVFFVAAVASGAPLQAPNAADKTGYRLAPDTRKGVVLRITVRETAPGVYSSSGPTIAMSGLWQLAIRVAPRGHDPFTTRMFSALRPAKR